MTIEQPINARVNFEPNTPVIGTLRYDEGRKAPNTRYGDQYMYGLTDGRTMWVEPEVHAALLELGAKRGTTVSITKKKVGNRRASWDVDLVEDKPEDEPITPAWIRETQPNAELMQGKPTPLEQWEAKRQKSYAGRSQAQPPAETAHTDQRPASTPQQPKTRYTSDGTPEASSRDRLLKALCSAIDAARLASGYAAQQGQPIQFSGEDIRAIALTVFIGQERNGSRF